MNRNGNSACFFSYVCNGKKIKELFASTLNGMTASVHNYNSYVFIHKGAELWHLAKVLITRCHNSTQQSLSPQTSLLTCLFLYTTNALSTNNIFYPYADDPPVFHFLQRANCEMSKNSTVIYDIMCYAVHVTLCECSLVHVTLCINVYLCL